MFTRISVKPGVMQGQPCIHGTRITVANIVRQLAAGRSREQLMGDYPNLQTDDIAQALEFAAWRVQEREYDTAV